MKTQSALLAVITSIATAAPATAQIVAQTREVSVSTYFLDAIWGIDPVTDSDLATSPYFGAFDAVLDAESGSFGSVTYADGEQHSTVDSAAGDLNAQGWASAGLYVQGTGDVHARSALTVELVFASAGSVAFDGELNTTNNFGGLLSHDDHGSASAEVRVETVPGGAVLFQRRVALGDPGIDLQGEVVALPAGRFRVTIEAIAADATVGIEQVNGSMAAGIYDVQMLVAGPGPLVADVGALSLATGGVQSLALDAGAAFAALPYLVVGSASGTAPGFAFGDVVLPLLFDPYSVFTVAHAGGPLYPGSVGVLDGLGRASAAIQVPAGLSPALAGTVLHHAFVVFDAGSLSFASDPAALTLLL